jgi:AraC-like DNA-binding protein
VNGAWRELLPTNAQLSDPLGTALALRRAAGAPGCASPARERRGDGFRALDIVCTSGPADAPFDEDHPQPSIAVVLAGTFGYRGEHGRALLTPGALLLGNGGAGYRCTHEHGEGDRCLAFHFEPDLFERVAADLGVRHARFRSHALPASRATGRLLAGVEAAFEDERGALEEAALGLAAATLRSSRDVRPVPVTARDERVAAETARLLEASFDRGHTLAALARRAGMSRFHFLRVFRHATGATPHQFLLQLRLREAARMLRRTDAPVTDVAYGVGFQDLSNFVRSFGAAFGASPSRYRAGGPAVTKRVPGSSPG